MSEGYVCQSSGHLKVLCQCLQISQPDGSGAAACDHGGSKPLTDVCQLYIQLLQPR